VRFGGQSTEAAAIFKLGGGPTTSGAAVAADLGHDLEVLGELFEAITDRRRVLFTYKERPRTVEPYGLGHRFGHWYLLAPEVGQAGTIKAFRLDRMRQLKIDESGSMFVRPTNFDPATSLPDIGRSSGDDAVTARIRFHKDVAEIAVEQAADVVEVDRDPETVTIELSVTSVAHFNGWMLGFDDKALIESPRSLVDTYLTFIGGSE
jgi:proteasome accessory factor C